MILFKTHKKPFCDLVLSSFPNRFCNDECIRATMPLTILTNTNSKARQYLLGFTGLVSLLALGQIVSTALGCFPIVSCVLYLFANLGLVGFDEQGYLTKVDNRNTTLCSVLLKSTCNLELLGILLHSKILFVIFLESDIKE